MKKQRGVTLIGVVVIIMITLVVFFIIKNSDRSSEVYRSSETKEVIRQIRFFRFPGSDMCFAYTRSQYYSNDRSLTAVACELVPKDKLEIYEFADK